VNLHFLNSDDEADEIRRTIFGKTMKSSKLSPRRFITKQGSFLPPNLLKKNHQNGLFKRWEHMHIPSCTFCLDDRMLFQRVKKPIDNFDKEWDSMIDVPLLPLTTSFMPDSFANNDYRQMNPSGFDGLQLRRKYVLELTIQRLTQNFQIVSPKGSLAVSIDPKFTITMSL
jgi:hypothetical protein